MTRVRVVPSHLMPRPPLGVTADEVQRLRERGRLTYANAQTLRKGDTVTVHSLLPWCCEVWPDGTRARVMSVYTAGTVEPMAMVLRLGTDAAGEPVTFGVRRPVLMSELRPVGGS